MARHCPVPSGQVHWKFVGFATQGSAPTYPSFPRTTITTIAFPDNGIFSVTATSLRPFLPQTATLPDVDNPSPPQAESQMSTLFLLFKFGRCWIFHFRHHPSPPPASQLCFENYLTFSQCGHQTPTPSLAHLFRLNHRRSTTSSGNP